MLKLLGKMFGSSKSTEKMVDGVIAAGDKLFYTEEEKAENVSKAFDQVVKWMEATQGQNLARRFIAVSVTMTWLVQIIVAQIMLVIRPWVSDQPLVNSEGVVIGTSTAQKLMESATVMQSGAESMTGAVMLVFGFYFAARQLDKIAGAALSRFGSNK